MPSWCGQGQHCDAVTDVGRQFVSSGHRTDKLSVPVASYINVSGNQWLLRSAENGSDVDTCKGERAEVSRQFLWNVETRRISSGLKKELTNS